MAEYTINVGSVEDLEKAAAKLEKASKAKVQDKELTYEQIRFLNCNRAFLGAEFLTWLLWTVATHPDASIKGVTYRLGVDGKAKLAATYGTRGASEISLKGDSLQASTELKESLRQGMRVRTLRVTVATDEHEWAWTMEAGDLWPRSLRVPPVMEPDSVLHAMKRVGHIETALAIIEDLFWQYMTIRLDADMLDNFVESFVRWRDGSTD
jgi:hypothetical protein